MTTPARHLIDLSGLTRSQVARAVGCTERALTGYTLGRTPNEPDRVRIERLTAAIEPLAPTPEERRRALLASSTGRSNLHRLIAENPTFELIHATVPVRERLGV